MTNLLRTIPATALAFGVCLAAAVACGPAPSRPDGGNEKFDSQTSTVDSFGGPNFGEQCTTSSECGANSYCVKGQNGDVCTHDCDAGCPDGWSCRATDVAGQLVSLCVPQTFDFCKPCSADVNCNGGVCVQFSGGGGGYCLPQCPFEGSCPTGYSCGADPSGAHTGNYCVPQTGSCSCTLDQQGTVRTCQTMNAIGTCYGVETCDANGGGGWTGCTAPMASVEVCDGMDNDCDQLIDDGVSGSACPITVAGVGTCPGVQLCTGTSLVCQGKTPTAETCNYSDDNCDGAVDELWTNLATVCSAGIGGCERFGVYRCNAAGDGTECSAVAGTPTAELCNGLDDNCNIDIDETFTTLGQSCTVGVGICARQGNLVCSTDGSTTQCSVTPGTPLPAEACNLQDDDCDNKIDEGFFDPATGTYHTDTSCGSCGVNCAVLYGLPNAQGHCVGTTSPSCTMTCNGGAFDLDGASANGCEFVLDAGAIYVSIDGPGSVDDAGCGLGPVGTGAGNYPCRTIAQGIARAGQLNRPRILVANGVYAEAVTIPNGRSLLGAYQRDNWTRDLSATATLITGVASVGVHDRTVIANNITSATLFEGFVVYGSVNSKVGGNSYAIYVSGSNGNLTIRSNVIFAGRGGPGTNGGIGGDGPNGLDGTGRSTNLGTTDSLYDAKIAAGTTACDLSNSRQHTNGGGMSCGADNVGGGNGGGNSCPAAAAATCTGCSTAGCTSCTFVTATSINGFAGQPGAGAGGGAGGTGAARGDDMILKTVPGNNTYCFIPSNGGGMALPTYGRDGGNGANGANGAPAAGCSATIGAVVGGEWIGSSASSGLPGLNGGGGGGGGAGGGAKCDACSQAKDNLGAHGGGGGAGACGGGGGTAATAGGGTFGIFIVGTSAPVVTSNNIFRGEGGIGGTGGAAGKGGIGGTGALGGTTGSPALFCSDTAGRGGNGGNGGHGSGGGGGCGGSSFGIFTSGIGSPNYCSAGGNNSISSGAGGTGGSGGYSLINTGGAGSAGALVTCQFN